MKNLSYSINVIRELAWNDFKVRYNGSVLGYLWTLIKPLLLFTVLYVVFSIFMRFPVEHYQLYLLLGVILWNFFNESTSIGLHSLISKAGILTKLYVPRWTIVVASLLTSFITLLLNLIIFLIFLALSPIHLSFQMLIFPIFLIELFTISLATSFLLSVFFIRFRDLSHIWDVLLQIGFWITPIIYPISMVKNSDYHWVFRINPLATIINNARDLFIINKTPLLSTHLIFITGLTIFLILSVVIFNKLQKAIVEHL